MLLRNNSRDRRSRKNIDNIVHRKTGTAIVVFSRAILYLVKTRQARERVSRNYKPAMLLNRCDYPGQRRTPHTHQRVHRQLARELDITAPYCDFDKADWARKNKM